jgi:enoyl-CoA hydratase/carnithine racemase
VFSAGYDIGGLPRDQFAHEAESLVAHPFAAALEALEAFPYPGRRRAQRPRDRRRARARADLRPADGRHRHQARDAAGQARARLLAHRHPQVHRRGRGGAHAELFFTGRNVERRRALEWGLVNEVVAARELAERAVASRRRSPPTRRSR